MHTFVIKFYQFQYFTRILLNPVAVPSLSLHVVHVRNTLLLTTRLIRLPSLSPVQAKKTTAYIKLLRLLLFLSCRSYPKHISPLFVLKKSTHPFENNQQNHQHSLDTVCTRRKGKKTTEDKIR